MKLYKQQIKYLFKCRPLIGSIAIFLIYIIANTTYQYLHMTSGNSLLLNTENIIKLASGFMIIFMIISYEFISKEKRYNLCECNLSTRQGYFQYHKFSALGAMITAAVLCYVIITIFTLVITKHDMNMQGITDVGYQCAIHIVKSLFVNIFLISFVGVLIGCVISQFERRVAGYSIMIAVIFFSSFVVNQISVVVAVLSDYKINLSEILDIINILPQGLTFSLNNALGFPIMSYRICLICFWIFLLATIIAMLNVKQHKKGIIIVLVLLTSLSFVGYVMPASRIDTTLSRKSSIMADQHYYEMAGYSVKESTPNFEVEKYEMNLDLRRLLKAKITMTMSKKLNKYNFTLSHSYKVHSVCNNYGKKMKYKRDGDTLVIYNEKKDAKSITIEYSGANEAYYSNSQGVNLHGSFPYYPVPGFRAITKDGFIFQPIFLKTKAEFDIKIKTNKHVYSNLDYVDSNHLTGFSTGPTLVSGLYSSVRIDGVDFVYPFLNGWNTENLQELASAVKKSKVKDAKVFIVPNMNKEDSAISYEQIITKNYFVDVDDLYDGYVEEWGKSIVCWK